MPHYSADVLGGRIGRARGTVGGWFDRLPGPRRTKLAILAIGAIAVGCAALARPVNWNEASHYAQVRAFNGGTPIIDHYLHPRTGDKAQYKGHFYSDKAPGLALETLPAFRAAQTVGVSTRNDRAMVRLLVIAGCVLPGALLLFLVWGLTERREPDLGLATAVMLGLGTILLPFNTLFFSHVLAATLGFAAYYLVQRARDGRGGRGSILAAGLLAGLAITTEYPLGILAVLIGIYCVWRRDILRWGLAYGGGVLIGVLPLLAYDWWAFGSPFHLSYQYVARNSAGLVGVGTPHLHAALHLLFGARGLFTVNPIFAAAIGGAVVLYREGRRGEVVLLAAIATSYLVYNASYYLPFGGGSPGPRFLLTVIPFFGLPLAAAFRKAPITTLSLAAISAATMFAATVTVPELATDGTPIWWHQLRGAQFLHHASGLLFTAALGFAVLIAALATRRPQIRRADLALAALGVVAWAILHHAGHRLLSVDAATHQNWGKLTLVGFALALSLIALRCARREKLAYLAAIPLLALLVPTILDHPKWALLTVLVALGAAAAAHLHHFRPRGIRARPSDLAGQ